MKAKRPIPAVRPVSRCSPGPLPEDSEATRISRVDPHTGRRLPLPEDDAGRFLPVTDPDATIIGAPAAATSPDRPVTAEVVPPRDARLTSDVTVAWAAETGGGPLRILRLIGGRRRRAAIMAAAAAGVILLAAALLASGGSHAAAGETSGLPDGIGSGQVGPEHGAGAGPRTAGAMVTGEPPADVDPAVLAPMAAEALADGRLGEARERYRSLAAAQPENRAWSLAMEILEASGGTR